MRTMVDISAEVAALSNFPRVELAARWQKTYKSLPPAGVRQELLIRAAAWHLQAKHLGGYSAETRRLLKEAVVRIEKKLADNGSVTVATADGRDGPTVIGHRIGKRQRRQLLPGARLLRDWNGRTHIVDVLESGFVFEAKVYPSLTAIAERITGVHRSGPRFFGL